QAAVAEQLLDLVRGGAGGDVEILGMAADHEVAHGAADQEGLVPAFAKAVEHAQRVGTDVLARDRVLVTRDDPQGHGGRLGLGRHRAARWKSGWDHRLAAPISLLY